jgi:Fe-S-cluster containining protein
MRSSDGVVSFHCTACGACCNSAPALSLPELFHHQSRFIGTLAIRRIEPLRVGAPWGAAGVRADAEDVAAFDALTAELCEPVEGPAGRALVLLAVQAFDEAALGRCPALGNDQRCGVHADRKPLACRAVPLEPLLPDRLQEPVLAERAKEAAFWGASCIVLGTREGHLPIVRERRVVEPETAVLLTARRRELAEDRRHFGRAVFELLRPDLFDHPERVGGLPSRGFLSLSLAPALAVIASASPRCRDRTLSFLRAQLTLMSARLAPDSSASPATRRELSALLRASTALHASLERFGSLPHVHPESVAIESFLGLGSDARGVASQTER